MKSKWVRILCLVLVCFTVFCMVAIITRIYTVSDLQLNFMGALLGTVITAVVTVVLLNGQSSAEEVKERNVKVFEKKTEIFQDYIDTVWEIWEDHFVTGDEYLKMTSAYYKELMLYLKKDSLKKIGECLKSIGTVIKQDVQDEAILRDNICSIINVLCDELSLGGRIDSDLFKDLDEKREDARKKRPKFNFRILGIPENSIIEFAYKGKKAQAVVSGENKVLYGDEEYSLTKLTKELMEIEKDVQPTPYWCYKDRNLKDLYEEKYARIK